MPAGARQHSRAGSGPGYVEADLEHELGVWDAQRLPLQLGVERVPAVAAWVLPCRPGADHHAEARGDRLGPAEARVPLVGAVGVEGNITDGRQRELVQDAWIVDGERRREDAVAANSVRIGGREPQGRGCAREGAPAAERILGVGMGRSSSLKECERAPEGARGESTVRLRGEAPGRDLAGRDRREERRGRAARGSRARRCRAAPARPAGPAGQTPRPARRSGRADIDRSNDRTARACRARSVIVDVGAELRRVAEDRLELGGDRRVIGAGESGRSERGGCRGGEQLNNERERDDEGGQGRAKPAAPNFARRTRRFPFGPPPPTSIRYFVRKENARRTRSASAPGAQLVTAAAR